MQDRPTAAELLRAAQDFCEQDLAPALEGRLRFHVRVLQNVLAILEREWEQEEAAVLAEWDALRGLFGSDRERPETTAAAAEQVRAWNGELATAIRTGDYDDRFGELLRVLRPAIDDKLAIANPRWAGTRD